MKIHRLPSSCEAFDAGMNELMLAYNLQRVGKVGATETVRLGLVDDDGRASPGGLRGEIYWNWLVIYQLIVPEELRGRGLGASLLLHAEDIARRRGCVGVWLDTFSHQAPDFYRKQGYEAFGELSAYPNEFSRTFFKKRLVSSVAAREGADVVAAFTNATPAKESRPRPGEHGDGPAPLTPP